MKVSDIASKFHLNNFFRVRSLIILAVLSLTVLLSVIAWRFEVIGRIDQNVGQVIDKFSPKSKVLVSVSQQNASESAVLDLEFAVLDRDQEKYDWLAKSLGWTSGWPKSIKVGISDQTRDWFGDLLPAELIMTLNHEKLTFTNITLQGLLSSVVKDEYRFASGSGKLVAGVGAGHDLEISIKDLASVIDTASKSGELYISPVFASVGLLGDKVQNVNLKIAGKRISGEVEFGNLEE